MSSECQFPATGSKVVDRRKPSTVSSVPQFEVFSQDTQWRPEETSFLRPEDFQCASFDAQEDSEEFNALLTQSIRAASHHNEIEPLPNPFSERGVLQLLLEQAGLQQGRNLLQN